MKMINLNHHFQNINKPIAISALSISVLVLLVLLFFLSMSNTTLAGLNQEKSRYTQSSTAHFSAIPLTEQEQTELEAVNVAIRDIVRPWPGLFKALEVAKLKEIHVRSVEPNVKSNIFLISAVTLNIDQMLVYITRLNKQVMFDSVSLSSTEAVNFRGKQATQFELSVSWQDYGDRE